MYKVHLFNGSAVATLNCSGPYRPGDRHPLLAFLMQAEGTEHDWAQAESWINKAGWSDVKFERAGTLEAERLSGQAEYLVNAFESAVQDEFGFVVYETPIEPEQEE